jgi:YbgC/YbaW family acyl-CoA thioester hydrolase
MPATHVECQRARHYECDAFGYLTAVTQLRWLQETAFAASTAVGFDFARYNQIGHLWLIRETEVENLSPLKYGNEVEIKTWVLDFRAFRSRRAYELRQKASHTLAVRASTDWVYVNAKTLQPARIPDEMKEAFFPEGAPPEGAARQRFPRDPAPAHGAVVTRTGVQWSEIDMMWHVNNARYLEFLEDAERDRWAREGYPMPRMRAQGFRPFMQQFMIEYRQPAFLADQIEIAAWYAGAEEAAPLRRYEIRRQGDGELLVRASARWQAMDLQTEKAIPFPDDFLAILSAA